MDPNNSQYDLAFSVAVVGDPASGKSTLVQQETTSFFNNGNGFVYADKGASEVSVEDKIYRVNDSRCLVHYIDIPGADRFGILASRFAAGACAIVYVFDVTSAASFEHIEDWIARANPTNRRLCAQLLIGNKCDQTVHDRQVSVDQAVAFARRHDMIFCATSAVTGEGVSDAFATLIGQIGSLLSPVDVTMLLDKKIRVNVRKMMNHSSAGPVSP